MEEPALFLMNKTPANILRVMDENNMNNILVVDNKERLIGYVTRRRRKLHKHGQENISEIIKKMFLKLSPMFSG